MSKGIVKKLSSVTKKDIDNKANTLRQTSQVYLTDNLALLDSIAKDPDELTRDRLKALDLLMKASSVIGQAPESEKQSDSFTINIGPEKAKEIKIVDA